MNTVASLILSPSEMRTLEQLHPNPRRSFTGQVRGERLTRRKGISIEFADYRDYSFGDDLRHLDWNVLARLDSAVIKTYQDEEDLAFYILLDCSKSMAFGAPTKFEAARKVAAALGLSALCGQDAVNRRVLGKRAAPVGALRSRVSFPKLASWLGGLEPEGDQKLRDSLREFVASASRAGIAAIISDGLDPEIAKSVRLLAARGFEVWFVQVLSEIELDPDLEGDLKLIDSESGEPVEITANSQALNSYRKNLGAHCEAIAAECRQLGGRYTLHDTRETTLDLVKRSFQREGWIST